MKNLDFDYCYHTHTFRCGHGELSADVEDYVKQAIDHGIKELGFSEHVFIPHFEQPGVRGSYERDFDSYMKEIERCQKLYKGKINIYKGFECEYHPGLINYYKSLLDEKKVDYLILGQHFDFGDFKKENVFYYPFTTNKEAKYNGWRYVEALIKGMETGLFTYVAHPDFLFTMFNKIDKEVCDMCYKICETAKKYNIPLEMNVNGRFWLKPIRLGYPNEKFFKIAGEVGNEIVIGVDAHRPKDFSRDMKYFAKLIKKNHLNFNGSYRLKK